MRKTILGASVIALLAFTGCMGTAAKPATDVVKDSKAKAEKAVNAEVNATKAEPSMKEVAITKAVEMADEKTDGAASKIIESVR